MIWILAFLVIGPLGGTQFQISQHAERYECNTAGLVLLQEYTKEIPTATIVMDCSPAWGA